MNLEFGFKQNNLLVYFLNTNINNKDIKAHTKEQKR